MRVVDGVHGLTTGPRTLAHPTGATGLAELNVGVLGVADLTDGGAAASIHIADFAGRHTQLGVGTVLGDELHGGTGGTRDLRAAQRTELDGVHDRTGRDVLQRQVVAGLDIGLLAGLNGVTLLDALGGNDVTLLAVGVVQQRDASGTVRVVLDVSDLGRHAVLVPTLEVDETVLALVGSTLAETGAGALLLAGAVEGVDVRHLDLEDLFDSLLDLHLVRVRGHHEGVLAAIGQGVALLRDDRLQDDVMCWLVNSDHDQASLAAGLVFASTKASRPSFVKTTY